MEIFNHPACTHSLGKPADMTDEQCASLPCLFTEDQGSTWAVSFWKPTPDELASLLANGSVTLWVANGHKAHPVVGVGVEP